MDSGLRIFSPVKGADGSDVLLCVVSEFTYMGEFMKSRKISTTVFSAVAIDFVVGCWCEYRGELFRLYSSATSVKKISSAHSVGNAFQYSLEFFHIYEDLRRCSFLDYVRSDNGVHYVSFSSPSFYDNVRGLVERIGVNLERLYTGENRWEVDVYKDLEAYSLEDREISVSNIDCFSALGLCYSLFGVSFVIKGRLIRVGYPADVVKGVFAYGFDRGLYEVAVQHNVSEGGGLVTRIRAYGSDKNLPSGYNKGAGSFYPDSAYLPRLMLPNASKGGIDYLDSPLIGSLGIVERTVFFDGSDGLPDIYPTIKGVTAQMVLDVVGDGVRVLGYDENGGRSAKFRIDRVGKAYGLSDRDTKVFRVHIANLGFDLQEAIQRTGCRIVFNSGACAGVEFNVMSAELDAVFSGFILTCQRKETEFGLLPKEGQMVRAGDYFVLLGIEMPDVFVKIAEKRLLDSAKDWLSLYGKSSVSYLPRLDEIYLARHPDVADSIVEGSLIGLRDDDLGLDGSEVIQRLSIKVGGALPTYDVQISSEADLSFEERLRGGLVRRLRRDFDYDFSRKIGGLLGSGDVRVDIEATGGVLMVNGRYGGDLVARVLFLGRDISGRVNKWSWERVSGTGTVDIRLDAVWNKQKEVVVGSVLSITEVDIPTDVVKFVCNAWVDDRVVKGEFGVRLN